MSHPSPVIPYEDLGPASVIVIALNFGDFKDVSR